MTTGLSSVCSSWQCYKVNQCNVTGPCVHWQLSPVLVRWFWEGPLHLSHQTAQESYVITTGCCCTQRTNSGHCWPVWYCKRLSQLGRQFQREHLSIYKLISDFGIWSTGSCGEGLFWWEDVARCEQDCLSYHREKDITGSSLLPRPLTLPTHSSSGLFMLSYSLQWSQLANNLNEANLCLFYCNKIN